MLLPHLLIYACKLLAPQLLVSLSLHCHHQLRLLLLLLLLLLQPHQCRRTFWWRRCTLQSRS
jgi:hypothetical protein